MTRRDAAAFVLAGVLGAVLSDAALRFAGPAVLNLGPNDEAYVRGFRQGWERDGRTTFHWASPSASVTLPLRSPGDGHVLRMRARRHFIEPSEVTLIAEGTEGGRFEVADDRQTPYRIIEVPLPTLHGDAPLTLRFEATSENPRPLAIALDWLEVTPGLNGFRPLASLRTALAIVLMTALAAPRMAGAGLQGAATHAAAVAIAAAAGLVRDPIAAERILHLGAPVYVAVACVALLLARLRCGRSISPAGRFWFVDLEGGPGPALLVVMVLVALSARLVLLLHPQFFYPDVNVHATLAWQLAKDGPVRFLQEFTAHQYRYSLGLQFESGHWYAFPYPPAFYFLAWPLIRVARLTPEVAVSVVAAVVNALEVLLIYGVARRVTGSARAAWAAAGASVVLPIFLVRLGLGYFPALVGHAVDVLVLLFLLRHLDRLDRPRVAGALGLLVALALLTYTQSLLNLGLILPLTLLLLLVTDRSPGARRRQLGLAAAGVLGVFLAMAVFYARYVPMFLDMRRGMPMPEEQVLTELTALRAGTQAAPEEPPDDPYAGPRLDLWRGVKKAAWRLWIFYGPFAPIVAGGVVWIVARVHPRLKPLLSAWALLYLLLNLASGGLPGPNLVRYNKDIEAIAPLCCAALGWIVAALWERGRLGRVTAVVLSSCFLAYGVARGARALVSTIVLER